MHKLAEILAALRRASSAPNPRHMYIKALGLTLMVQYLFKEKPFLVLRCTSKKH
jgi:hypothetical protein